MSFNLFEAAINSDTEVGLARQAAQDKFAEAIYDVKEKLGPFLFAAKSLEEFRDRVAMTKNDQSIFKIIDAHIHPGASVIRRIVGRNGALEREFKDRLRTAMDVPGDTLGAAEPGDMGDVNNLANTYTGRRHQAELDGNVDVKSTYKPSDDTLEPEGDFDGYLNKVDQGASGKIDKLFASRDAIRYYTDWCRSANLSPIRLSTLDHYAQYLDDEQYLRLANTIIAWENEHKPKVPSTKLKKRDKVAAPHAEAHDWYFPADADEDQVRQGDGGPPPHDEFFPPEESYEDAEQAAHHLPIIDQDRWGDFSEHMPKAASVPPWESEHHPKTPKTKLPKKDKVAANDPLHHYSTWCDRNNLQRLSVKNLAFYTRFDPQLRQHLGQRMQAAIRTAYRTRTAAPDYLQKADDALTQLLNQKAEEFQETIAPLQQALITVQQAEQIQQQQNPLNVLPPAGTVNVMPGQPNSPAGQLGMPDPNSPDLSGLIQMLGQPGGGAMGGIAPGGQGPAPAGGNDGAQPPPAAAAAGAPSGVIPQPADPTQQKASAKKARGAGRPRQGLRKGAPFAGYEDFDDCTSQNSDKDRPDAYCGEIKHKTEDKTSRRRQACWPGCHENEEHVRKYHKDKKQSRRRRAGIADFMMDVADSIPDLLHPENKSDHPVMDWLKDRGTDEAHKFIDHVDFPMRALMRNDLPQAGEKDFYYGPSGKHERGDLDPSRGLPGGIPQGRHEKSSRRRKQAWTGWGPAVFPKTRQVQGWKWDSHLSGYIANSPQKFACECGSAFDTPSGFQRCACGKQWNSYVIGGYGPNKEASADKYLVREIPVRPDVIVANRRLAAKTVQMLDPRTGAIVDLIDPGAAGEGEDPGHPTFKKPPRDWAQRSPAQGNPGQWTKKGLPV